VPPRDSAALEAALEQALADRERLALFGRAGAALASERFGLASVIRQTLGLYSELLGAG
jgi:glycosyltransferase involved in cell wall biosynthesis